MKHQATPKTTWWERAQATARYHANRMKANPSHTLTDTANELRRSLGSISEDILIAAWLITHERHLKEFKYAKDALAFIREKKKRMMVEAFE